MKFTTRNLLIVIAIAAFMIAMLRVPSPLSVVVILICTFAMLAACTRAYFISPQPYRRLFGVTALTGFTYLFCYVISDSVLEVLINNALIIPFAIVKADPDATLPDSDELGDLLRTMEFQYFLQKMHLLIAVFLAFTTGLLATYLFPPDGIDEDS